MELHKGQILENKYEILEKIGVGGFSTIKPSKSAILIRKQFHCTVCDVD